MQALRTCIPAWPQAPAPDLPDLPDLSSPHVHKLVEIEKYVGEVNERLTLERFEREQSFLLGRRAHERNAIRQVDLVCRVVASLLPHAVGEDLSLTEDEGIVHQRQRLR